MSKRRSPQDKADVVVEFFTTRISAAELCRRHNVSPAAFQDWKEKFLQGGRQAPASHGDVDKSRVLEIEHPGRIIAGIAMVNDVLKKLWRGPVLGNVPLRAAAEQLDGGWTAGGCRPAVIR